MLTKGAIGNLVNRYKAVLKKCNLINMFGSLAVASMLVMGATGVAEASDVSAGGKEYTIKNEITTPGERAYGGWKITGSPSTEQLANTTFALTVENGTFSATDHQSIANGMIFGGNYVNSAEDNHTFTTNESTLIINNAQVEYVIAGSGNYNTDATFDSKKINLIINDGFFGKTTPDTNVPELYVVGGDYIKCGYSGIDKAYSHIENANVTINGGTFHAAIIGGSAAVEFYNKANKSIVSNVDNTNIKITGGSFSHPIVAGGFAYGAGATIKAESNVKNAKIDISGNVKMTGDANIYAGGIRGAMHSDEYGNSNVKASVSEKTEITVKNATILGIYGTNAGIKAGPEHQNPYLPDYSYVENWQYTSFKDEAVNTELKLTNATATGEVFIPKGKVELRVENKGKVKIADFKPGDGVSVTMSADSVTNDAFGGDAQKLVDESFDMVKEQKDGSLIAEAGAVVGEVTGKVVDGVVSNVVEKKNETVAAMSDLPTINHMLTRVEMNDLRKRMGDIRLLEGNTGVWARWDGGKLKGDSGLTNDFHKIQIGADTVTGIDNLRLGASFSYTNGDMDFAKASAESDTLSFAGYGVWTAENGIFADVIARLAVIDTEVQTNKVEGDLDNLAFSLSGEFGWRYDFCNQFFVEPQVELTYTYIDSDEFKSNGAKFEFDDSDSLIGRAGLAAGWKLPNDLGDLYARASVVQEFMGDGKLTASMGSTRRYTETDGDDTWFEYGVGANVKVSKNAYVFADVERTEGAKIDEEWRGTVGFRFNF